MLLHHRHHTVVADHQDWDLHLLGIFSPVHVHRRLALLVIDEDGRQGLGLCSLDVVRLLGKVTRASGNHGEHICTRHRSIYDGFVLKTRNYLDRKGIRTVTLLQASPGETKTGQPTACWLKEKLATSGPKLAPVASHLCTG